VPTYRLHLEYDGTRYHGWQEQKNARTVAGELRRAIEGVASGFTELAGAGRTDAGVHALEQAAHLRLRQAIDPGELRRSVNDALPPDIHVLSVTEAGDRFHARHTASSRSYLYQISRRRTALGKRFVWWVKRPLDPSRMKDAAARIAGRHDFRLFCERASDQPSTIVVVESAEVTVSGSLILVRFVASHFLWKMVRRLVGCLVRVGASEMTIGELEGLLDARPLPRGRGTPAEWTAPPSGLFLERVSYPGDPPIRDIAPAFSVREEPGPASSGSESPTPIDRRTKPRTAHPSKKEGARRRPPRRSG
jgi:tRNA pseudouridine38-40 synthase